MTRSRLCRTCCRYLQNPGAKLRGCGPNRKAQRRLFVSTRVSVVVAIAIAAVACWALARAAEPNWPEALTLATASPGGTYHSYGSGLARMLTRVLGIPVA